MSQLRQLSVVFFHLIFLYNWLSYHRSIFVSARGCSILIEASMAVRPTGISNATSINRTTSPDHSSLGLFDLEFSDLYIVNPPLEWSVPSSVVGRIRITDGPSFYAGMEWQMLDIFPGEIRVYLDDLTLWSYRSKEIIALSQVMGNGDYRCVDMRSCIFFGMLCESRIQRIDFVSEVGYEMKFRNLWLGSGIGTDEQVSTLIPTEQVSTLIPTEQVPTLIPTEQVPTLIPTEQVPTLIPTEQVPTLIPTEQVPTLIPTEQVPTLIPTEQVPTEGAPLPPTTEQGLYTNKTNAGIIAGAAVGATGLAAIGGVGYYLYGRRTPVEEMDLPEISQQHTLNVDV